MNSHWARGTAWAVYGFALSHGYTGDPKYLEASLRIARKFIYNLNGESVPVWDFNLPAKEEALHDSSAAAVAVCGFQELAKHKAADIPITQIKQAMLARLCTGDYLNFEDACPGVLKNAQIGDGIGKARNAYTSWGDYYLMEALSRELDLGETWW